LLGRGGPGDQAGGQQAPGAELQDVSRPVHPFTSPRKCGVLPPPWDPARPSGAGFRPVFRFRVSSAGGCRGRPVRDGHPLGTRPTRTLTLRSGPRPSLVSTTALLRPLLLGQLVPRL